MRYPLNLRFKLAAIASQIYATDADGQTVFYVKQKMFKLKEDIEIYTDDTKSTLLYHVKADKIIDFSPTFTLYDTHGASVGSVKREGARSIWKASYSLQLGSAIMTVRELNPWVKVIDSLFSEIPVLGFMSGYIFQPKYGVYDQNNTQLGELNKLPAFFEGKYNLACDSIAKADDDTQHKFAALMMVVVLRERMRG